MDYSFPLIASYIPIQKKIEHKIFKREIQVAKHIKGKVGLMH